MMKSGTERSYATTSAVTKSAHPSFIARATDDRFIAPARQAAGPAVQAKMESGSEEKVQKAPAPEEKVQKKEEEKIQKAAAPEEKVQKAPAPEEKVQKKDEDKLQKAEAREEKLQRKENDSAPALGSDAQSAIRDRRSGGQQLSDDVRGHMEPRFDADFSNVRIHNDAESASLNNQLGARAFTYQNHIFFSRGQYQPGTSEGKRLLAHELTHTIQQGHTVQQQNETAGAVKNDVATQVTSRHQFKGPARPASRRDDDDG